MVEKDLCSYWQSIATELEATKNRVRNLIGGVHWASDGSHKEILLRRVLERHLPEELSVCTGFIYKNAEISTQIDILVISKSGYTLFKKGEFVIVTPHAVRAIIEVKTSLDKSDLDECLHKLAKNARLTEQELVRNRGEVWSGLFVYDGDPKYTKDLLLALNEADNDEDHPVTCVAYGPNLFTKFWATGAPGPMWASHACTGLAAGCFVMDMIAKLTRNPGVSDFQVLNKPVLDGKITPTFQVKRGENKVEPLPGPE
jgi:hypothetical protein